jgi:hypothetical protein
MRMTIHNSKIVNVQPSAANVLKANSSLLPFMFAGAEAVVLGFWSVVDLGEIVPTEGNSDDRLGIRLTVVEDTEGIVLVR